MSGHARHVPEASIHPAVRLSLAACLVMKRQTRTAIVEKVQVVVRAANAFSWNTLRSHSLSRRPCSLAVG